MSDDFLTQIQHAEDKAMDLIEKAHAKAKSSLTHEGQKLEQGREKALEQGREKARERLKERQVEARKTYEELLEEGRREAKSLGKEGESRIAKAVPQAQAYFINDLLG